MNKNPQTNADAAPAQVAQHTPGPWAICTDKPEFAKTYDLAQDTDCPSEVLATIRLYGNDETRWANARLIAAAPELLQALEHALERLEASQPTVGTATWEVIKEARAAIAKANGNL